MQTCPYILYVFQIEKGMSHELGFFLVGRWGGTHPKTEVHAGVKTTLHVTLYAELFPCSLRMTAYAQRALFFNAVMLLFSLAFSCPME
jgi:hypothetical protein